MYAVAEPPLKVPAAVAVPRVSIFAAVVLTIPAVRVKVLLTDKGIPGVTPPELVLLTVRLENEAVVVVVELRNTPEPEIVCGSVAADAVPLRYFARKSVPVVVSVPLLTILPAT